MPCVLPICAKLMSWCSKVFAEKALAVYRAVAHNERNTRRISWLKEGTDMQRSNLLDRVRSHDSGIRA